MDFLLIPQTDAELNNATDLYDTYKDKLICMRNGKIVKCKSTSNPRCEGYLYSAEDTDEEVPDLNKMKKYELLGLHTYGGYYQFFRPDIIEVFWLISQSNISEDELDKADKIYLTTFPDEDFYDSKNDRHRAITYVFIE